LAKKTTEGENFLRKTSGFPPSFVTPAIFKPGSTVFKNQRKSKNLWMPDKKFQA